MKKNLRVFVSSFMVGVMTATSTAVPGLSAVAAFAAEDEVVDEVESPAAVEVVEEETDTTSTSSSSDEAVEEEEESPVLVAGTASAVVKGNLLAGADGDFAVGETVISNKNIEVTVPTVSGGDNSLVRKDDSAAPVTVGENEYTFHYQTGGKNTAKTTLDGDAENAGTFREAFAIKAVADGTLSIDCKVNDGKTAAIVTGNETDGFTTVGGAKQASSGADEFVTLSADLKAGDEVLFIGKGTNVPIYALYYEVEETPELVEVESENLLPNTPDKVFNFNETVFDTAQISATVPVVSGGDNTFVYKDDSAAPVTVGENEYTYHYQTGGKNTAKTTLDGDADNAGTFREALEFDVKVDGTISVDCKVNDGKTAAIVTGNETDGFTTVGEAKHASSGADEFVTLTADVKAGDKVLFIGKGTNVPVYSVKFTYMGEAEEPGDADFGDLAAPEKGVTYSADFVAMAADEATKGMPLNGVKLGSDTMKVTASENTSVRNDAHGSTFKPGDKIEFAVAGKAKIEFTACIYGRNTWTLTDASGAVLTTFAGKNTEAPGHEEQADGAETPQYYTYKGDAGVLTLTFDAAAPGETYVHKLDVTSVPDAIGEYENFEMWFDDVAQDVDGGLDNDGNPKIIKTFDQREFAFKDNKVKMVGNKNTAYEDGLEKFTPNNNNSAFMNLTRNGETHNAYKAGNRNSTANDITTIPDFGDGTALEFECVANGTFVAYVYTTSFVRVWDFDTATGERLGYTDSGDTPEFVAIQAEAGHTYVFSTTGKTNNCGFCGVEYAADKEATIAVDPWNTPADSTYNFDSSSFTLEDVFLGTTAATIKKNTKSVDLAVGHTYEVKSADAGVGATFAGTDSPIIKITEDTKSIQLDLVEIPDVILMGDIFTSNGADPDVTSVKFKNKVSGNITEAQLSRDGKLYTAYIKPGDYDTIIESEGFTTIDHVKVLGGQKNENDIYLKANDPNFIDMTVDIEKPEGEQRFTYVRNSGQNESGAYNFRKNNATSIRGLAGDQIIIPVSGKQKVTVAGWYSGSWDINGQNAVTTSSSANAANPDTCVYFTDGTETSVTVNLLSSDVVNYLYWVKLEDVNEFDANNTVIQVPSEKFPTLKSANEYIGTLANRPDGEEGRMTIELTDDIEEQIVFTEPYITVKGNGHKIHWYYGVGSFYYSIDKASGLFDEELYYDKYNSNEGDGSLWGGVAIIRGDHFIAEDTVFQNTYNYEVTEMDASDFVRAAGGLVNDRQVGTNVGIYSGKERSNAFYIDADDIQVYNCEILSSQDTFGRNGSANNGYHVYVKDSVIGGNVDYICGEFTAVFDNCELQWKTYTDDKNNDKIGYITAAKTSPYVFRNCVITQDDATKVVKGAYGRTWGANSNAAFLYTQTNNTITDAGWGEMTTGDGASATFYDYCNFDGDGDKAPATSFATEIPEKLVDQYTSDEGITNILTFTPVDLMSEKTTVVDAPTDSTAYADAPEFTVLTTGDVPTAAYEVGNDTILIAAVKDLTQDKLTFVSSSGKVIASTKWVYDSIQLSDDLTVTAKDLGLENGYLFAVKVVGVRSGYMTADGCKAREDNVEGFKAVFGEVEEVADIVDEPEINVVDGGSTTA